MDNKHIKVILDGSKLIKISSRRLADGSWSVVGWGPSLSVRSTDIENDQLLYDFAYAVLFINNADPNDSDAGEIVSAIRASL
jgi:hypothetical protein